MRAWVFERSGPYSSTAFDIHKEAERFIPTIAGYVMMSDEELGLDSFIEQDDGDRFITVVEDATGNIVDMREGLTFGKPYAFRNTTMSPASSLSQSQSLLSQSFGTLDDLSIAREPPKKRKSMDTGWSPSKRSRSNSQNPDKAKRKNETNSQTTSLYARDDTSFENRISRCLVISPAGRALRDFESKLELLEALRDAIKAHRFLYPKGKILHRYISENNIIITNPREVDGFPGMLIDEDLAKEIGSGRSGARHQTGTMEFMAIEVLQRIAHTYRHDLESFFYVLLWICARRTWEREFKCKPGIGPKETS